MTSIPPLFLEQIAHGELAPERVKALQERFGVDDEALAAEVARLKQDDLAILERHPTLCLPHKAARRGLAGAYGGAAAVAGLAAVALMAWGWFGRVPQTLEESVVEQTRIKGLPAGLEIWRKRDGGKATRLEQGAVVNQGDLLQVKFSPATAAYGLIASIDGAGVVTLHHPASATASTKLAPGAQAVKHAYELDDAPGFETFLFFTAPRPLPTAQILERLRAPGGVADLSTSYTVQIHTLQKEAL